MNCITYNIVFFNIVRYNHREKFEALLLHDIQ